ncbi:unnamed protein product [Schistosoma mattheei]|uniref:Uncharacterized protein n=1 Tax=Schistosoma mattheei TaxID=31246 RepID=A0A3P8FFB0_9TREM|nr:unnamed protein product [Schistosoma mattheei]
MDKLCNNNGDDNDISSHTLFHSFLLPLSTMSGINCVRSLADNPLGIESGVTQPLLFVYFDEWIVLYKSQRDRFSCNSNKLSSLTNDVAD